MMDLTTTKRVVEIMPKYVYHCKTCEDDFEIVHGMTERQEDCVLCGENSCLDRIPQISHIKKVDFDDTGSSKSPGDHVREAIKDNAEILKEQKRQVDLWEYKDDV